MHHMPYSIFETEFALLKKDVKRENIETLLNLIDFCESQSILNEEETIDSQMDVMKYTLKVLDKELISYELAEETLWSIIEDIETGVKDVYQKSSGYGEGYYELPQHKQSEWYTFKNDVLSSLESFEHQETLLTFDDIEKDPRYDERDDDNYFFHHDYNNGGYSGETWDTIDL